MFDFSFYELLVFGIIALIVLGPEKLPQAVRTLGTYYAKFRRTVSTIKAEMEAELDLAETRQLMQEELSKIRQTEAKIKQEMNQLRDSMQEFEQQQNLQLQQTLSTDANTNNSNDELNTAPTQGINHKKQQQNMDQLSAGNQGAISQDIVNQNAVSEDTIDEDTPLQVTKRAATKAKRPNNDRWVHPVAGANPQNPVISAESDTFQNNTSANNANHTDNGWRLPMTRPWENMWFLLGDYDRVRRLPPAPFLPNHKANPLLNAMTTHSADQNSATRKKTAQSKIAATASSTETNS